MMAGLSGQEDRCVTRDENDARCQCLRIALARAREVRRLLVRRQVPGVVAGIIGEVAFGVLLGANLVMALCGLPRAVVGASQRRREGMAADIPAPTLAPSLPLSSRPPADGAKAAGTAVPRHRVARAFRRYCAWKALGDTVSQGGVIVGRTGVATRPPPEVRFLSPALLAAANGANLATLNDWSVMGDAIIRQLPAIAAMGDAVLRTLPSTGRPEVGPPRDVFHVLGVGGERDAPPCAEGEPAVPDVHGDDRQ